MVNILSIYDIPSLKFRKCETALFNFDKKYCQWTLVNLSRPLVDFQLTFD